MVDKVLDPCKVGVAWRRSAKLPADVGPQALATPVAVVEGRVGEYIVGAEVFVEVAVEGVCVLRAEVGINASDGEVHPGEAPGSGVGLLAVHADIADASIVMAHELLGLHKHAPGTAARVVDSPAE